MAYGGEGYGGPDKLDEVGLSRLHKCARTGKAQDMRVLLDGCQNVDIPDRWGKTPLMTAVEAGQTDTVKLLLERGADPTWRSHRGEQPVFLACTFGHLDIVRILSEKVDIARMRDARGSNALHYAVQGQGAASPDLIRLLLAKGLSPLERDSKGSSSLRLAEQAMKCHVTSEVYKLLKEWANVRIQTPFDTVDLSGAASPPRHEQTRRPEAAGPAGPSCDSLERDVPRPYSSRQCSNQSTRSTEEANRDLEELRNLVNHQTELIMGLQRRLSDPPPGPDNPTPESRSIQESRVLSEPNLLSLARKIAPDTRYMMAIYLGFRSETWEEIDRQHTRDSNRATFEVLCRWVKLRNSEPSLMVEELCGVLDQIHRPDLKAMLKP